MKRFVFFVCREGQSDRGVAVSIVKAVHLEAWCSDMASRNVFFQTCDISTGKSVMDSRYVERLSFVVNSYLSKIFMNCAEQRYKHIGPFSEALSMHRTLEYALHPQNVLTVTVEDCQ